MAKTKEVWKNAKRRHLEAKFMYQPLSYQHQPLIEKVQSCHVVSKYPGFLDVVYLALGNKLSNTGMKQKFKTSDAFRTYKIMSSFTLFCFYCFFLNATIASSKFKKIQILKFEEFLKQKSSRTI